MPSPSATFLEILPPELQVRVFACLSTKERARLPLVCKALDRLVNDPGSLLWETLDLRVDWRNQDAALQCTARKLLRARGRRTRTLRLLISRSLHFQWRGIFATTLPRLCPELQELVLAECEYYFLAGDVEVLVKGCCNLKALDIVLCSAEFAEAVVFLCRLEGLTNLRLETTRAVAAGSALQEEALQPLQGLTRLRHLAVLLGTEEADSCLPACLPSRLLQLESLVLVGCQMHLPDSPGQLQCLTYLRLADSVGWADVWPAVAGLPALRALDADFLPEAPAPPPLRKAAMSTSLTGLTCWRRRGQPEQGIAAGGCLALPALQVLATKRVALAPHLDWSSLTALQALTCIGQRANLEGICKEVRGLSRLTSLTIREGEDVSEAWVADLCQLQGLRRLELVDTCIVALPDCLASAKLTALELVGNEYLAFTPAEFMVLEIMPSLLCLLLCVCEIMEYAEAPAVQSRSLVHLRAISKGLDACRWCRCHGGP